MLGKLYNTLLEVISVIQTVTKKCTCVKERRKWCITWENSNYFQYETL